MIGVETSENNVTRKEFKNHIEVICQFIIGFLQIDGFSQIEQLQNVCQLILDICSQFNREQGLKKHLTNPMIEKLLDNVNSVGSQDFTDLAKNCFESIENLAN